MARTKKQEAAVWRKIGLAFEKGAENIRGRHPSFARGGLCYAAASCNLPAYDRIGARVPSTEYHGLRLSDLPYIPWKGRSIMEAAHHRAMTAYLIAEMAETEDAWAQDAWALDYNPEEEEENG